MEHSNLPSGATFRGNLLSRLTLVERSQPEGVAIVEGVEFADASTTLITTSGHRICMPAWATSEEIHDAMTSVMPLAPLDPDCWESFPHDMTPWAIWLTLHYDLASVEGHLDDDVPGLHLVEVHRDGELARIVTGIGDDRFRHEVPLTEQPLAIAVDLAFEVMRRRIEDACSGGADPAAG
ncbi:hypothetical protein [Clavibacter capsici]|uniref:hypothetical protein n=1 Tax=Clavibacter capsici TaxID=1874630 RepID=UPI00293F2DDD|nr:hypothetical protein [Clavibacter capsici]